MNILRLISLFAVLLLPSFAHAQALSALPSASTLTGAETIPCVQGGVTCKTTSGLMAALGASTTVVTLDRYTSTDLCATTTGLIDVISTSALTLIIDRPVTCTLDKTVPSTLALQIVPGGKITMTNSKLLQITGPFDAPMNQKVFFNATAGQGTVNFKGQGNVAVIYPMWWGAIGDYSTASGPAIQAALVAASDLYRPSFGGGYAAHVELGSGGYLIATPGLHITCFVLFKGQSVGGTVIQTSGSGNDYNMITVDGSAGDCSGITDALNVSIRDMKLIKVGGTTASSYIKLKQVFQIDIRDVSMSNSTGHGITVDNGSTSANTVIIDHVEIGGAASNVGNALNVVGGGNITEVNVSHEAFLNGIYCPETSSTHFCQISSLQPYFEGITGTNVIIDGSKGSSFYGPLIKVGGTGIVGFSFINGAHHNSVFGGNVMFIGDNGLFPPFKTDATSFHNCVYGANWQTNLGDPPDQGICWEGVSPLIANYQASMTPDLWKYNDYRYTFDSSTAWTMNAPLNASPRQKMRIMFRNTGSMGAGTFNAAFKMPTFTAPANGSSRTYEWECDGTNCVETFRSAADVPN